MANESDADPPPPPDPENPEPRRSPINPFEAARTRHSYPEIRVMWSFQDMQVLRPDWTPEQCERFMLRHASKFAAGMIRMGLAVLAQMAADPKFTSGINTNGDGKAPPPPPEPPKNN